MKLLHLSNDFANSHVYGHLVSKLKQLDIEQVVFSAVKTEREIHKIKDIQDVDIHVRHILGTKDRVFYTSKIKKITSCIDKAIDPVKIDVVHAHTLYSDGGVALKLKKKYKIPYIITVRNTDINIFMKYRPDLNQVRDNILLESCGITTPSPAYPNRMKSLLPGNVWEEIKHKITVIPNGVDSFWLLNKDYLLSKRSAVKLLYVGKFEKRKNVLKLIKAVELLNEKREYTLTLVGGGGGQHNKIIKLSQSSKYPFLSYIHQIDRLHDLKNIYRNHDIFVMPSCRETFGLVYIEALSQGLPILHSKGEGIDGYFDNKTVSEAVDCSNIKDIIEKIELLSDRMDTVRKECIDVVDEFDWEIIAKKYQKIYNSVLF